MKENNRGPYETQQKISSEFQTSESWEQHSPVTSSPNLVCKEHSPDLINQLQARTSDYVTLERGLKCTKNRGCGVLSARTPVTKMNEIKCEI